MLTDILISLRLAVRARLLTIGLILVPVLLSAVYLAGQFSGRQPATVALDVGLSTLRLALPIVIAIIMQEILWGEFNRKNFLLSATYPRPRSVFLLARVFAVAALITALLLLLATLLAAATHFISLGYKQTTPPALGQPYWLTIGLIGVDSLLCIAVATVFCVSAKTQSFVPIGTLGFTLIARSYSAIAALLTRDDTLVMQAEAYRGSLNTLGYLIPDLGALDVRMIALYGQWSFLPDDLPWRVAGVLIYASALLALSAFVLDRKQFS